MEKKLLIVVVFILGFYLNISAEDTVLSTAYFTFPHSLPVVQVVECKKIFDKETRKLKFASNTDQIKTIKDLDSFINIENEAITKKYGALSKELRDKFDDMDEKGTIKVYVSMQMPPIEYLDKTKHTEEELKKQSLEIAVMEPVSSIETLIKKHDLQKIKKHNKFTFEFEATKNDLKKLMFDESVAVVGEVVKKKPCSTWSFYSLAQSAANPFSLMQTDPSGPFYGYGVRAATLERGVRSDQVTYRNSNPYPYVPDAHINPANMEINDGPDPDGYLLHSNQCFSCLYYAASRANFYHIRLTNDDWFDNAVVQKIISREIQTASISLANYNNANDWENLRIDKLAYIYPFPVFCMPVGNDHLFVAGWNCYNAISVGNIQHSNLTNWRMPDQNDQEWCSWQNPEPLYGGPLLNGVSGDREMPYIVSPGYLPGTKYDNWNDNYLVSVRKAV